MCELDLWKYQLVIHHLVYIRIGHDTEAASGAVGVIGIRTRPLLGLLEKGLHVLPAPASVSKALPLVKVLAVTAEVYHPIQHAEIKSIAHTFTLFHCNFYLLPPRVNPLG